MKQFKRMEVPEEHILPEETIMDIYADATFEWGTGEVRSEEAQSDKQSVTDSIINLIESVREEGFRLGYQLGYSHGIDGLPDEDEDEIDFLEADEEEEGWV